MKESMKFDLEKEVFWSIEGISSFHKERAYKVLESALPVSDCIATVVKSNEAGFICKVFLKEFKLLTRSDEDKRSFYEQIRLESGGENYLLPRNHSRNVSTSISEPQVITLNLNSFQKGTFEDFDNKKLRLIIPVSIKPNFECIDFKSVKIKDSIYACGGIEVLLADKTYHIFKYVNNERNENYLIIDSLEKNKYDEFKVNSNAIILGFGLVSGNYCLGEYYYHVINDDPNAPVQNIAYQNNEEESVLTGVKLLDPFQFRAYIKAFNKAEILETVGSRMSSLVFSNLCKKIKENETYSRCSKLILEGHDCEHLLLKGGIYSIAIETLSGIIYDENSEKINPISDEKLVSLMQNKMREIISEFGKSITEYGKSILEAKINDLNKPTNSKKLSMPFKICGIELTKSDLTILETRNKFLHGSTPISKEELGGKEREILFAVLRLQFLVMCLMFKYIGYSGHLMNYRALVEFNSKELNDDFFRIV